MDNLFCICMHKASKSSTHKHKHTLTWHGFTVSNVIRSGGLHPWPDKTQTSRAGERETPAERGPLSGTPGPLSPSAEPLPQWKPKQRFKNEEVSCSLLLNLGQSPGGRRPAPEPFSTKMSSRPRGPGPPAGGDRRWSTFLLCTGS